MSATSLPRRVSTPLGSRRSTAPGASVVRGRQCTSASSGPLCQKRAMSSMRGDAGAAGSASAAPGGVPSGPEAEPEPDPEAEPGPDTEAEPGPDTEPGPEVVPLGEAASVPPR